MTREPLVELDGGFLTGYRQGPTAVDPAHGPRQWMRGTAYTAAGDLVPHARRTWSSDNANAPVSCDPEHVDPPARAERLAGRWLYAGHWTRHFGHCLLEVLPTLWPEPDGRLDGIVVHRSIRSPLPLRRPHGGPHLAELTGWQAGLFDLAGYGGLPVRVVRGRAVRADRLVVPSRPVVFRTEARPAAVDLWRRVRDAVPPTGDPARHVFLSRRRAHEHHVADRRTRAEWDDLLEEEHARRGFAVVHPEELDVREQVRLAAGADVIAGSAGSALHLAVFARAGTTVLEVGDRRTPHEPQSSQQMVNRACGLRSRFAPYGNRAALRTALDDAVGG